MTDFRALCAELVDIATAHCHPDDDAVGYCAAVLTRARAALAQPEPQGPGLTDEELLRVAAATIKTYEYTGIAVGEYEAETECVVEAYGSELIAFARAVLARWGRPAVEPMPNQEADQ